MAIDIGRGALLTNGMGGLSGPGIRPIACMVRMRAGGADPGHRQGDRHRRRRLEFLIAAHAVSRPANFVDRSCGQLLYAGIAAALQVHHACCVADLVGSVQTKRTAASKPSCMASRRA